MAQRPRDFRHEDREVTPHAQTAGAGRRRAEGTQKAKQAAERLKAGVLWEENDLVFCTRVGTALDSANVRRGFRKVITAAKIEGKWTPRELRHSFISLLSANGTPIETIALLAGHASTRVTEVVYRHELRPVLTEGAELIDSVFGKKSAG